MPEALDPAAYVYEGIWTDWTKGKIHGLTWTLCPNQATLLTNILALFVTFAGGQLWTIVRFGLHQWRASQTANNVSSFQVQEQLVLRNTGTDLHTMRLMAELAWTSRSASGRPYQYPLAITLLAIFHYALFVTAGTFSNKLVNPSSNKLENPSSAVLSRSPHCGVWNKTYYDIVELGGINIASPETIRMSQEYFAKTDHNVQLSLEYAQQCYESSSRSYMSASCDTFPTSSLAFEKQVVNGSCPFGEQMCHDERAIVFETAVIDSHHDLGINAPKADRLTYRRRTTCAVLNDTERVVESNESTADAIAFANYGFSLLQGTNHTYAFSNYSSLYTDFTAQSTNPYQLNTQYAYGPSPRTEGMDSFIPVRGFDQGPADLLLFFMSFNGRYFEPIDDPWFAAHHLHTEDVPVVYARTQYERDRMISTLGCLEQHQFCDADGKCTPYGGWGQVQNAHPFSAALNPHQRVTFDRMIQAVLASSIAQVTASLAATKTPILAIDAAAVQSTVLSLKLPNNQWELELMHWHNIAMAQLQRTIVQWATGQIAPNPETQLVPPEVGRDVWFCKSLMVPSTVYQSFSILYLAMIAALGTLVILISWNIEAIASWIQLRFIKRSTLRNIWDEDQMLRLRRAARASKRFTDRFSWKPRAPPKDDRMSKIYTPPSADIEMAAVAAQYSSHGNDNKRPRRPRFPQYHISKPDTESEGSQLELSHQAASTPRVWSDLPPEPCRDSWVDLSLDESYDPKVESLRGILESIPSKRAPFTRQLTSDSQIMALSELRSHGLARSREAEILQHHTGKYGT